MPQPTVSIRMKNGTTKTMARSYAAVLVAARAAEWVDEADAQVPKKVKRPSKRPRSPSPPRPKKPANSDGTYRRRDMRPDG